MDTPIKQASQGTPLPSGVKKPAANTPPTPAAKPLPPPGWWSLSLSGTRAAVSAAVNASTIPAHEKTALVGRIASLDAGYNFIKLDAHNFVVKGKINHHATIAPSTALL